MRNCPEVAILMATYNGEKYLAEQLESLLRQKISEGGYKQDQLSQGAMQEVSVFENTDTEEGSSGLSDYKIYIHDDGSNDNTVAIIHSYVEKYPDKFKIIEGPPTRGAKNNFFYLMREVSCLSEIAQKKTENLDRLDNQAKQDCHRVVGPKYYFFCDQDDVWLENKLQVELTALQELENEETNDNRRNNRVLPSLVWCDMRVVDEQLNEIAPSFSEYSHLDPEEIDLDRCIMHGKAAGCSIACNAQLIKSCCQIEDTRDIIMHDWALFLIARMTGLVQYIDTPLALYRQHGDNSVGAKEEGKIEIIISIVKRVLSMKQLKTTQENLKRYIAQVASLMQVKEVYKAHRELIDGAIAFENMHRIDKVRYVNRFRLYRHKNSKLWTLFAALLMK